MHDERWRFAMLGGNAVEAPIECKAFLRRETTIGRIECDQQGAGSVKGSHRQEICDHGETQRGHADQDQMAFEADKCGRGDLDACAFMIGKQGAVENWTGQPAYRCEDEKGRSAGYTHMRGRDKPGHDVLYHSASAPHEGDGCKPPEIDAL